MSYKKNSFIDRSVLDIYNAQPGELFVTQSINMEAIAQVWSNVIPFNFQ